jgi:hypothetical protein
MNTSPDHPDFTALALGEHIHGAPAQTVLEALRTSVAARVEAEQIQFTARRLTFALKGQPPLRLDAGRRNAIFTADPAEIRARFAEEERAAFAEEPVFVQASKTRRTWIFPTLAAAAVAVAALVALRSLPGYTPPSQRNVPGEDVANMEKEPDRKIMVTPPIVPSPPRIPVQSPAPAIAKEEPAPPPPQQVRDVPPAADPPAPPVVVKEVFPRVPVPPERMSDIPRKRDPGRKKK